MNFSSLLFVFLFLALNLISQTVLKSTNAKNNAMLAFSLFFYAWASPRYLLIMLFDVFVCWLSARLIDETSSYRMKKVFLVVCLILVLGVLGVFKYLGFILGNLNHLTGFPEVVPKIVLPVGISFYTFQLISYVVDVYRGDVDAQPSFKLVLLYASLFHQCIAGPIVRYADVENDILNRRTKASEISRGISRFTVGLAKKVVLADSVAVVADLFLAKKTAELAAVPALGLWLGGLCFMFQIYLDFSAYSDMAIGMGLMCGFHYLENFNYPYIADSVTDFWRRWHISLSSFFRDYVYIPLGGNRCTTARQIFNLFVVWALTGFWHGASWNYVIWGLYFLVFLILEKCVIGKALDKLPGAVRRILVLLVVFFCWIIFKFEDLGSLGVVMKGLFGLNGNPFSSLVVSTTFVANLWLLLFAAVACVPLGKALNGLLKQKSLEGGFWGTVWSVWEVLHPVLLLLLSAMVLAGNSYRPFLYFQF